MDLTEDRWHDCASSWLDRLMHEPEIAEIAMEPVDLTDPTFGFKAPPSAAIRQEHLLVMRCASMFRRSWPLLRALIGVALFVGVLFWNREPSATNLAFAFGALVLWFAVLWTFSGRDRLATADIPETLTKQGHKGSVFTRNIVSEVRKILELVDEPGLSPDLELRPPPEGEIPGFKVSFALVSELIQETLRRSPNVINTEVVQTGATTFLVRFRMERDNRVAPPVQFEADKIDDAVRKAALALLRIATPYHAALHQLKVGNRDEAAEIAHAAAKDERVPRRTRAFCWCLLALMRLAGGDIEGSARALHYAEDVDMSCPATPLLVLELLRSDNRDCPTEEAIKRRADVRAWYGDLAKAAGRAAFSTLHTSFLLVATARAARLGRENMIEIFEKRIAEVSETLENAIAGKLDGIVDLDAEWRLFMYLRAARQVEKISKDLTGRYRPEIADTPVFHEKYVIISQRLQNVLSRVAATGKMIEIWRPEAEQARVRRIKRGEELKHTDPELYRQFLQVEQSRQYAMKQAQEVDQIGDAVDETMTVIESQTKELEEARERARKWRSLEDTPLRQSQPSVSPQTA
jgi:hypothetical protein